MSIDNNSSFNVSYCWKLPFDRVLLLLVVFLRLLLWKYGLRKSLLMSCTSVGLYPWWALKLCSGVSMIAGIKISAGSGTTSKRDGGLGGPCFRVDESKGCVVTDFVFIDNCEPGTSKFLSSGVIELCRLTEFCLLFGLGDCPVSGLCTDIPWGIDGKDVGCFWCFLLKMIINLINCYLVHIN